LSVVIVGIIRRKPVLTHASIVCEDMLASVNSVHFNAYPEPYNHAHSLHVYFWYKLGSM